MKTRIGDNPNKPENTSINHKKYTVATVPPPVVILSPVDQYWYALRSPFEQFCKAKNNETGSQAEPATNNHLDKIYINDPYHCITFFPSAFRWVRLLIKNETVFTLPATNKQILYIGYRVNDKQSIKKLVKDNKNEFIYDDTTDQKYLGKGGKIQLEINYVDAIEQYGVYAVNDIKPHKKIKMIGIYKGDYIENIALNDPTNRYLYDVLNNRLDVIGRIDARKRGNWTRFVNHSFTPNLYAEQKKINGETVIAFFPFREIKTGEQLTIDYGKQYVGLFKSFYLDSSDNWESCADRYQKNKHCYSEHLYIVNNKIKNDLGLPSDGLLLIPSIFLDIETNNITAIKEKIKKSIELYAYSVNPDSSFMKSDHQQHITPLMFACYLQKLASIRLLMAAEANPDKHTLNEGKSPLMLLLLTSPKNNKEAIEKIAIHLLKKMEFPFVENTDGFNILHYAIKWNMTSLVRSILERAEDPNFLPFDVVTPLINHLNKEVCHFDFCLLEDQFEMLQTILNVVAPSEIQLEGDIAGFINKGECFKDETLRLLTSEKLNELEKLIKQYLAITQHTKLLERIEKIRDDILILGNIDFNEPYLKKHKSK